MTIKHKHITVVVLGDIGRSPRMQYHCLSLSDLGHQIDVIGYGETEPMDSIKSNPFVFYHYLMPVPILPFKLLNYVFKTIFQAINLLFILSIITRGTDMLIVQNPPAVPALIVCWLYTKLIKAKLVVDWHNYGHTILAMSVGTKNPLVKVTKYIEGYVGRRAFHNFCVTKAMKRDLEENWKITASVLYDRPPQIFKPISPLQKSECLKKFSDSFGEDLTHSALLVSSTSWTEDEDFSMLLSALQVYEEHCQNGNSRHLPKLICVITGKGPLKKFYCDKISKMDWKHVTVITPWLEHEEYSLLLASADLGVCLHTSSSGLDLPMKVIDMFGCGLPVCAFNFKCLDELVRHNENSYTFQSEEELSNLIINWFDHYPNNEEQNRVISKFRNELNRFQSLRWEENWTQIASPVFN